MSLRAEPSRLAPAEVFAFLLGAWSVEREVSGQASLAGTAHVRTTGGGAAEFCEHLAVRTIHGAAFAGSQRYEMRQTADGFALYFARTTTLFQDVRFVHGTGLHAEARHHCGQDSYESTYRIGRSGDFILQHTVRGPRKNYSSISIYRRVGITS